jgi:hypothetical protein
MSKQIIGERVLRPF